MQFRQIQFAICFFPSHHLSGPFSNYSSVTLTPHRPKSQVAICRSFFLSDYVVKQYGQHKKCQQKKIFLFVPKLFGLRQLSCYSDTHLSKVCFVWCLRLLKEQPRPLKVGEGHSISIFMKIFVNAWLKMICRGLICLGCLGVILAIESSCRPLA